MVLGVVRRNFRLVGGGILVYGEVDFVFKDVVFLVFGLVLVVCF